MALRACQFPRTLQMIKVRNLSSFVLGRLLVFLYSHCYLPYTSRSHRLNPIQSLEIFCYLSLRVTDVIETIMLLANPSLLMVFQEVKSDSGKAFGPNVTIAWGSTKSYLLADSQNKPKGLIIQSVKGHGMGMKCECNVGICTNYHGFQLSQSLALNISQSQTPYSSAQTFC